MKRFLRGFNVLVVLALMVIGSHVLMAQSNSPLLLGINTKDSYPNGCVDCHRATGGKVIDMVKKVANHPNVAPISKVVPKDCLMCHKAGGAAAALSQITHKQHYKNPKANDFIAKYGGSCLSCHSLNLSTGKMTGKNGNKNW